MIEKKKKEYNFFKTDCNDNVKTGYNDSTKHLLTWIHDTKYSSTQLPSKYLLPLNFFCNSCLWNFKGPPKPRRLLNFRPSHTFRLLLGNGREKKDTIHRTKLKTNLLKFERNSIEKNSFLYILIMTLPIFGMFFEYRKIIIFCDTK